jgi:hypothetical protein
MADFVVTSDRTNLADVSLHYIVRITDPTTIELARKEVNKQSGYSIVSGTIQKQPAVWNPNWTFFVRPSTVGLGQIFSQTCDVSVKYIQLDLQDAGGTYLPNLYWCPSNSRILRELEITSSSSGGTGTSSFNGGTGTSSSSGGTGISSSNGGAGSSSGGSSGGGAASSASTINMMLAFLATGLSVIASLLCYDWGVWWHWSFMTVPRPKQFVVELVVDIRICALR